MTRVFWPASWIFDIKEVDKIYRHISTSFLKITHSLSWMNSPNAACNAGDIHQIGWIINYFCVRFDIAFVNKVKFKCKKSLYYRLVHVTIHKKLVLFSWTSCIVHFYSFFFLQRKNSIEKNKLKKSRFLQVRNRKENRFFAVRNRFKIDTHTHIYIYIHTHTHTGDVAVSR